MYEIIYADPPWSYRDKANAGCRGAVYKYPVMTIEDICTLPVRKIAAKNSILFLWTTFPQIFLAEQVIDAWGFVYKTVGFVWVKTTKSYTVSWGMGNWTRSNAEVCLLATRGKPKRLNAGVHSVVHYPRMRHSQKPPVIRYQIEKLCGRLPRIELFARESAPGWDVWGNEVECSITLGVEK